MGDEIHSEAGTEARAVWDGARWRSQDGLLWWDGVQWLPAQVPALTRVWSPPGWKIWLPPALLLIGCAYAALASAYARGSDVVPGVLVDVGLLSAPYFVAAALMVPKRRPFIIAGTAVLGLVDFVAFLGLFIPELAAAGATGALTVFGNLLTATGALAAATLVLTHTELNQSLHVGTQPELQVLAAKSL